MDDDKLRIPLSPRAVRAARLFGAACPGRYAVDGVCCRGGRLLATNGRVGVEITIEGATEAQKAPQVLLPGALCAQVARGDAELELELDGGGAMLRRTTGRGVTTRAALNGTQGGSFPELEGSLDRAFRARGRSETWVRAADLLRLARAAEELAGPDGAVRLELVEWAPNREMRHPLRFALEGEECAGHPKPRARGIIMPLTLDGAKPPAEGEEGGDG